MNSERPSGGMTMRGKYTTLVSCVALDAFLIPSIIESINTSNYGRALAEVGIILLTIFGAKKAFSSPTVTLSPEETKNDLTNL